MTDTVSGILKGHFRKSGKGLEFSISGINEKVREGDCLSGSFSVRSLSCSSVRCQILSDNSRLTFSKDYYEGESFDIFYEFDARCLGSGVTEKGRIYFVTNEGEYSMPVHVEVVRNSFSTSQGEIRNLFHFTNLAHVAWDEAKTIFYSGSLERILTGNDDRFLPLYRVLSSGGRSDEALDEFLIRTGKKSPAEYVTDVDEVVVNDPLNDIRRSIRITRNGWGAARLSFDTDSSFIRLEKQKVTEDDFLGNEFDLGFFIESDRLHGGLNPGVIKLICGDTVNSITVNVFSGTPDRTAASLRRRKKELHISLTNYYLNYMLEKISLKTWEMETTKIVDVLSRESNDDPEPILIRAFTLLRSDRHEEAAWYLKQAHPFVMHDSRTYMTSLYLCLSILAASDEESGEDYTARIRELYDNSPFDWRTALVLLHTDTEFAGDAEKKFSFLRTVYDKGCRSPILFCEAYLVYRDEPSVLQEYDVFELHLLSFMQKNSLLKKEQILKLADRVQKSKSFRPYELKLLQRCYQTEPDDSILYVICSQLMKASGDYENAFRWYEAGVKQDLRITGLFDRFMMSMDISKQHEIPVNVLRYYSYECTLPREFTAYLYRYVASHKAELNEYYIKYMPRIIEFTLTQLEKKRLSKDLAWLYLNELNRDDLDDYQAGCLASLLFTKVLKTDNPKVKNACCSMPQINEVFVIPFSDGKANVPVYFPDSAIALEDDEGKRVIADLHDRIEELMDPENVPVSFLEKIEDNRFLDLYLVSGGSQQIVLKQKNYRRYLRIAGDEVFSVSLRRRITPKIIKYLSDHGDEALLEPFLALVTPEMITLQDAPEIMNVFLDRRLFTKAFQWVSYFGAENMDGKVLLSLANAIINYNVSTVPERDLLELMSRALGKGAYDEVSIRRLMRDFMGTLRMLSEIWKAAMALGLDRTDMDERIIRQVLESGAYLSDFWEICRDYISQGDPDVDLVAAVVMQESYEYFTEGKNCDRFLFSMASWLLTKGYKLHRVCGLAYVQYFSEHFEEITEDVQEHLVAFIHEQDREGTVLDCYSKLTEIAPVLLPFRDRNVISYRSAPGKKVLIHYLTGEEEQSENEGYRTEEMYEEFDGYYVKMFILFFGEKLEYYITETDSEEKLTKNGTATHSDPGDGSMNRFELLDDICTGVVLHDYEEAEKRLYDYMKNDHVSREIFGI